MPEPLILQKVVFPSASEPDVTPLYVDPDEWSQQVSYVWPSDGTASRQRAGLPSDVVTTPLRMTQHNAVPMLDGRRGLRPGLHRRVSLSTYFNAFPASYWRRWTRLDGVTLHVETRGRGDVIVYRSNARGVVQMVDSIQPDEDGTAEFELSFDNFIDGGWYWFDLISRSDDFALVEADWRAPERTSREGADRRMSISITTLNRTEYCLEVLRTLASDADVLDGIDRVYVVDQGSRKVRDEFGFAGVEAALGGRLRLIEQVNAGGSGGFSRGMIETLSAGTSSYLMLLDDDVTVEPESIRRSLMFSRLTLEPTIVGGHMFDMYDKTKLHAFGEAIDTWPFLWGPIITTRHDFAASSLRATRWMHQRMDVAYNGWWMSMIPVEVIREVGLSLPVFIKWDDAEYSLRAKDHGYSTVSLPGAAVWHVSWVDKDDSRDWQAYYHARNRLVAALLHSPHERGGRLPLSNLASDVRHLLSMDYYTVKLRQEAYNNVLRGPRALHPELLTRLPRIRSESADYRETRMIRDLADFERFPESALVFDVPRPRGRAVVRFLARNVWHHAVAPLRPGSDRAPERHLPRAIPWWDIPAHDSVAVTNAEGSAVAWHVRDRDTFRSLLWSAVTRFVLLRVRWVRLRRAYRKSLPHITSERAWRRTLGLPARGRTE